MLHAKAMAICRLLFLLWLTILASSAQTIELARDGEIVSSSKTACIKVTVAKGKVGRVRIIAEHGEGMHGASLQLGMKWDGRTVCGGKGSSSCQYDATIQSIGVHQITITTTTPPYKLWRFLATWAAEPNIQEVEEVDCK